MRLTKVGFLARCKSKVDEVDKFCSKTGNRILYYRNPSLVKNLKHDRV